MVDPRWGRNDPCLPQLRRHAWTWNDAVGLAGRHYLQAGVIRIRTPHQCYGWECLAFQCGNVEYTKENSPPGLCTACLSDPGMWVPIVAEISGHRRIPVEHISAREFEPGLWWWLVRAWGYRAPQLVLCDVFPPRMKRVCGDCSACPDSVRYAARARAKAEYEAGGT